MSEHSPARAQAIAGLFQNWWQVTVKPLTNSATRLDSVRCTDQASAVGTSIVYTTNLPQAGTRAGDPLPGSTAVIVTLQGLARGRANRGRIYFPGEISTSINAIDGTTWDPGITAPWAAAINTLMTNLNAMTPAAGLAVLSRSQGLAVPVVSTVSRPYFGTQRRRVRS